MYICIYLNLYVYCILKSICIYVIETSMDEGMWLLWRIYHTDWSLSSILIPQKENRRKEDTNVIIFNKHLNDIGKLLFITRKQTATDCN